MAAYIHNKISRNILEKNTAENGVMCRSMSMCTRMMYSDLLSFGVWPFRWIFRICI